MGGEHICYGCNQRPGMPHREDCSHVTAERLTGAAAHELLDRPHRSPGYSRLLVTEQDCLYDPLGHVKKDAWPDGDPGEAEQARRAEQPDWGEALQVAQEQAYGALNMDPQMGAQREARVVLAATAQALATIAVAQELRAVRDMLGNMLGDGSHLDGLKDAVRELESAVRPPAQRVNWMGS